MADLSPLRRRMIEDMSVRNLSPATQRSYVSAVSKFSRYCGRSPDKLGLDEVRDFQVLLVSKGVSWGSLNQIVCALRFFYGVTLNEATVCDPRSDAGVPYGFGPRHRCRSASEPRKISDGRMNAASVLRPAADASTAKIGGNTWSTPQSEMRGRLEPTLARSHSGGMRRSNRSVTASRGCSITRRVRDKVKMWGLRIFRDQGQVDLLRRRKRVEEALHLRDVGAFIDVALKNRDHKLSVLGSVPVLLIFKIQLGESLRRHQVNPDFLRVEICTFFKHWSRSLWAVVSRHNSREVNTRQAGRRYVIKNSLASWLRVETGHHPTRRQSIVTCSHYTGALA